MLIFHQKIMLIELSSSLLGLKELKFLWLAEGVISSYKHSHCQQKGTHFKLSLGSSWKFTQLRGKTPQRLMDSDSEEMMVKGVGRNCPRQINFWKEIDFLQTICLSLPDKCSHLPSCTPAWEHSSRMLTKPFSSWPPMKGRGGGGQGRPLPSQAPDKYGRLGGWEKGSGKYLRLCFPF